MDIDVIYEKGTNRVVLARFGDNWVIPNNWDMANFRNGSEPILGEIDGDIYLKPNGIIIHPEYLDY